MNTTIVKVSEHSELIETASAWFHEKWGIPQEIYRESMERARGGIPEWYLCMEGGAILGGAGVIENDFHDRPDLTPNVCAVFTEESHRARGIARALLDYICADMRLRGVNVLYLVTDHTSFYERCGWTFLGIVHEAETGNPTRMYLHRFPTETAAIRGFFDADGRLKALPAKTKKKLLALSWLADQLPVGQTWTEREFNAALCGLHSFGDPATLRRELYDCFLIDRTADGRTYAVRPDRPTAEALIAKYT